MSQPRIRWIPQTPFGVRALRLMLVSAVLFGVSTVSFAVLPQSLMQAQWFRMSLLPASMMSMLACGVIGGVYAWLAIVRQHERAVVIWAVAGLGLLIGVFLLGEFIAPH